SICLDHVSPVVRCVRLHELCGDVAGVRLIGSVHLVVPPALGAPLARLDLPAAGAVVVDHHVTTGQPAPLTVPPPGDTLHGSRSYRTPVRGRQAPDGLGFAAGGQECRCRNGSFGPRHNPSGRPLPTRGARRDSVTREPSSQSDRSVSTGSWRR